MTPGTHLVDLGLVESRLSAPGFSFELRANCCSLHRLTAVRALPCGCQETAAVLADGSTTYEVSVCYREHLVSPFPRPDLAGVRDRFGPFDPAACP